MWVIVAGMRLKKVEQGVGIQKKGLETRVIDGLKGQRNARCEHSPERFCNACERGSGALTQAGNAAVSVYTVSVPMEA